MSISHILISESASVYGRYVFGLLSGLSVCCRLQFQQCANDRFSIGVMSVMYRSQIGRFHTESYPRWPRHETDCFCGVFSNIVGGRQLADSLQILLVSSVLCRFGRCDWGIMTYITHSVLPRDWWPFPPPRLDAQRMATHNQTTKGNSVRFDTYNIKMVTKTKLCFIHSVEWCSGRFVYSTSSSLFIDIMHTLLKAHNKYVNIGDSLIIPNVTKSKFE